VSTLSLPSESTFPSTSVMREDDASDTCPAPRDPGVDEPSKSPEQGVPESGVRVVAATDGAGRMGSAEPIVDVDAALVERVQRGDQKAFEMSVVKYQRRIERSIARMVRDVDSVEDIAQEAFIRAYRALPNFRG
ncbi:hypothetical protein OY671_011664, partial [Metschnikowia pulcherrima]